MHQESFWALDTFSKKATLGEYWLISLNKFDLWHPPPLKMRADVTAVLPGPKIVIPFKKYFSLFCRFCVIRPKFDHMFFLSPFFPSPLLRLLAEIVAIRQHRLLGSGVGGGGGRKIPTQPYGTCDKDKIRKWHCSLTFLLNEKLNPHDNI